MKKSLTITKVKVSDIKFTPENAREITEESLNDLKKSIETLGVIRPLILMDDMTLVSGNQRTKTLKKIGAEEVDAVIMSNVSTGEAIRFTLLVNSLEYNNSLVKIKNVDDVPFNQFHEVKHRDIHTVEFRSAVQRRDIAQSLVKFGQWGTVVISEDGRVIFNSDYASVCETMGFPVTVYKVTYEQEEFIMDYFFREYGIYSYDHLDLPSYPQTYVQPRRSTNLEQDRFTSITYSQICKSIWENEENKSLRIADFGAGKKIMANLYRGEGFQIDTYEPFYKVVEDGKNGGTYFDIEDVVNDINIMADRVEKHGLYNAVICDSVLNSTISKKMENYVIATVSALTDKDGFAIFSTRSYKRLLQTSGMGGDAKTATDDTKRTFELDNNHMFISYRKGFYVGQKFHTVEELSDTLGLFFDEVEHIKYTKNSATSLYFKCSKPKHIDREYLSEVLNEEFNMEYPEGYRHNQQGRLVDLLLKENDRKVEK
jgi:ParB family transcriptional regulator, chromosome partitioning protein